jgi:hypothetical protein
LNDDIEIELRDEDGNLIENEEQFLDPIEKMMREEMGKERESES